MIDYFAEYRAGRIDFGKFERETRHIWVRLARGILGRWRAPTYVTEQDLVQEMLIAAYSFTNKWDPKHSVPVRRYVVWNAIDKARKWLHKQRRAGHDGGRGRSGFDLPFASLVFGDNEERADVLDRLAAPIPSDQESEAAYRQMLRQFDGVEPVIRILERTGSPEAAVEHVMFNQQYCEWFGITRLEEAEDKVGCMIDIIAEQVTL